MPKASGSSGFGFGWFGARFENLREFPHGWSVFADNDENWRTTLSATKKAGGARLDPRALDGLIRIEKWQHQLAPPCSAQATINIVNARGRRRALTLKDDDIVVTERP